jgi:hypothetical protein
MNTPPHAGLAKWRGDCRVNLIFVRDAAKGLGYFAGRSYKIKERVEASFCLDFLLLFHLRKK